jgi:tRNA pseudouridine55 synthase
MDISGILLIDKPGGITSHDVVVAVRRTLAIKQVGHFGTLDPFATGVLPLSLGKATRFAQFYLKSRKAYEGGIRFGFSTDTYDATGQPTCEPVPAHLDRATLEKVFTDFTGCLMQTPPSFSAKRVGGVRAYKLARAQKPAKLEPVTVEVYALQLLGLEGDEVHFAVECAGGTYVRSLAHDIGQRIGCPAHLSRLRRTTVAEFNDTRAIPLDTLKQMSDTEGVTRAIIPMEALLPDCPELVVRGWEEQGVRHGQAFELARALRLDRGVRSEHAPPISLLKVMNTERRLIAIARHVQGAVYHPDVVLV